MEILKGKENLISLIDLKIHHLFSLKCDHFNDDEISRFRESDLEDKVNELSSIAYDNAMQFGVVLLTISGIIGITIFAISFAISKNVILSLGISVVSLCAIWIFMKLYNRKDIGTENIKIDIEYDELSEVDTVKEYYDFWNSDALKIVEVLDNTSKTNVLMRSLTNMIVSMSNYATFKTRYYDNMVRLKVFGTKVLDGIWDRNENAYAEEFVEYFVKNTSAWSCRKEIYQMIMFICTELIFMYLFLSIEGFDQSIISKNDVRLCINESMRCVKESDNINELTIINKILTFALDVDDYCQKKLDNINAICN